MLGKRCTTELHPSPHDSLESEKQVTKQYVFTFFKSKYAAGHQWLVPVILASWKTEIRRIVVQGQPRQNSSRDPISKNKQS
jgi:hypothetical protein